MLALLFLLATLLRFAGVSWVSFQQVPSWFPKSEGSDFLQGGKLCVEKASPKKDLDSVHDWVWHCQTFRYHLFVR